MSSIIRITAGKDRLTLASYTVCRLLEGGLEGFESPPPVKGEILPSALGDGDVVLSQSFSSREIMICFEVTRREAYREVRDKLLRMMACGDGVDISVNLFGRRRYIKAYPTGKAEFLRDREDSFPIVKLRFICPDPFFSENVTEKIALPPSVGLLTFPLNFMSGAGSTASFAKPGFVHKIYNGGDVSCGFRLVLAAHDGEVTEPVITLNGKRLQLMQTLTIGDVAEFDTRRGNCGVRVNGNLRYNFARQSSFFQLEPGENELTVMSMGDSRNFSAEIEFTPLYVGA